MRSIVGAIDAGPLVESNSEIWQEIDKALSKGKVEAAAAALRRHLEFVSRQLADQLGASPQFRADGNYELGELLPSVLKRAKDPYGKAVAAAQSWENTAAKDAATNRKDALSVSNGAVSVEQWAVNEAVHYNEWANFGRKDFEPVVAAFRDLVGHFQCGACQSFLYLSPRGRPESLRWCVQRRESEPRSEAEELTLSVTRCTWCGPNTRQMGLVIGFNRLFVFAPCSWNSTDPN